MKRKEISQAFIDHICDLYGDYYDDTEEDSSIGGSDWAPGQKAEHKSLRVFQGELKEQGIKLSTSKIRKILITGGRYSTELSRSIEELMEEYEGLPNAEQKIAEELGIKASTVRTYVPYKRQVYNEDQSDNAKSIKRWRDKKNVELQDRIDKEMSRALLKLEAVLGKEEAQSVLRTIATHPDKVKVWLEKCHN